MAVQAGCGFKPPTPVFAVPLPVSGEPPRRPDVASSPTRDPGSDVIMAGRRSGQWVTLSKALLLQLVERICQLSFQTDVVTSSMTSSNSSSRLYRKSSDELSPEVETENIQPRRLSAEHGGSPSKLISEKLDEQNGMEDSAVAEDSQTTLCQDDSGPTLPDSDQTTSDSGATSEDVNLSCCGDVQNSTAELDVDDESVEKAQAECDRTVIEVDRGPPDAITSDENHLNDRHLCYHHHHRHHHRHQRSACRRRLLRTRRLKKPKTLATSGGQVRHQITARRGDDTSTATERRPHLHGVRRCRQSWMALSKDIVYGAVENELRQVEGSCRSVVPAAFGGGSAANKSAAIWNPATCLSPSEKRRSRASYSDLDSAPRLPDFRYRDVTFHQTGNDVCRSRNTSGTGSSSMLSELLGFGSAVALPVPTDVVLTRHRRCSCSGGDTDVISPSAVISGSGVENHPRDRPVCESSGPDDVTTAALNYCIRRDGGGAQEEAASAVQTIWRPVEPAAHPIKSTARRVTRPRWVAVNKGDVCSLVDSLVSTMIASEDGLTETVVTVGSGDVRDASTVGATPKTSTSLLILSPSSSSSSSSSCNTPALPVSARCSVAASEPRKWKSDLLQRMRNEDT